MLVVNIFLTLLLKIDFMRKFGYLDKGTSKTESLYHEDAIVSAIKNMQKYGALNESGILDNETLKVCWCSILVLNRYLAQFYCLYWHNVYL